MLLPAPSKLVFAKLITPFNNTNLYVQRERAREREKKTHTYTSTKCQFCQPENDVESEKNSEFYTEYFSLHRRFQLDIFRRIGKLLRKHSEWHRSGIILFGVASKPRLSVARIKLAKVEFPFLAINIPIFLLYYC